MKATLSALALLCLGGGSAAAEASFSPGLVLTASNATSNALLIYDTKGKLLQSLPTFGQGGVAGNAGGIGQNAKWIAVVNAGSNNVSIFSKHQTIALQTVVPALASPVSVALSKDHLYILSATQIESHLITPRGVDAAPDGSAKLLVGDGSAAQVGILTGQLIFTEKSNAIETVALSDAGAVTGTASMVANIPANVNAPFGLATDGTNAYVTIAHANELSVVNNNTVQVVTSSGTQMAPCWVALDGQFLFSANTASLTASRYTVSSGSIVQDDAVIASFAGKPADIAYNSGLAAVIDSTGTESHLSVFAVDKAGDFTREGYATIKFPAANGVIVVTP
jgi:DNA-binding beta-propeller fold protein YncE